MLARGAPVYDSKGRPRKTKDGKTRYRPYKIRVFNTIDFNKSHHYNPLAYIHSEKDILKLVTVLMENTKGDGKAGDPFWESAERLLLTAYIAYMYYFVPKEERTFASLIDMLDHSQVKEDDTSPQSQTIKETTDTPDTPDQNPVYMPYRTIL